MPRRKRHTAVNADPATALQSLIEKYRRYGNNEGRDLSDLNHKRWPNDDTWLHLVARHGGPDELSLLVASGADVNMHGDIDNTALHEAATCGKEENVTRLLELGADPRLVNIFNETAEHWALTGAIIHPERKDVYVAIAKLLKKAT